MTRLQQLSVKAIEADELEAPFGAILDAMIQLLSEKFGHIGAAPRGAASLSLDGLFVAVAGKVARVDVRLATPIRAKRCASSSGTPACPTSILLKSPLTARHEDVSTRTPGVRSLSTPSAARHRTRPTGPELRAPSPGDDRAISRIFCSAVCTISPAFDALEAGEGVGDDGADATAADSLGPMEEKGAEDSVRDETGGEA